MRTVRLIVVFSLVSIISLLLGLYWGRHGLVQVARTSSASEETDNVKHLGQAASFSTPLEEADRKSKLSNLDAVLGTGDVYSQVVALRGAVEDLSEPELAKMFEKLSGDRTGKLGDLALGEFLESIATKYPRLALEIASTTANSKRVTYFQSTFKGWAKADPDAAVTWLENAKDQGYTVEEISFATIGVLGSWHKLEEQDVKQLLESRQDSSYSSAMYRSMLRGCGSVSDFETLFVMSQDSGLGKVQKELSYSALGHLAMIDPTRADDLFRENKGSIGVPVETIRLIAKGFAHTDIDLGIKWLESLSEDELPAAVDDIVAELGSSGDPMLGLSLIREFEGTADLSNSKEFTSRMLAESSIEAATNLANSISDKQHLYMAFCSIGNRAGLDGADLSEVLPLVKAEDPTAKEALIRHYFEKCKMDRLPEAISYLSRMENSGQRKEALYGLANLKAKLPEGKFSEFIESSDLTLEEKTALLSK